MKKRTIGIVLLVILFVPLILILSNWSTVQATIIQRLKNQIRQDFLAQDTAVNRTINTPRTEDAFSFALVTDIHNNTKGLTSAVQEINSSSAEFTIGLGDYTDVGTKQEFDKIKQQLNKLNKPYWLLPGDHDLWNGRDKTDDPKIYFSQSFPNSPQNQVKHGVQFLFLDNADLYQGVNTDDLAEFKEVLLNSQSSTTLVFSHKAITHPLTIHRMGYINDTKNEEVAQQAAEILEAIQNKKNTRIILFSGDLHTFSKYTFPGDKFEGYTIGALTETKNFQTPRFAIVHIGKDNSVTVEDKPINK